ncbi:hypothetical protein [Kitasatospora sp. NPDC004289]
MSTSTTPITAGQYDSWPEEKCTGIEIVDGMAVVSPSAAKRHNSPGSETTDRVVKLDRYARAGIPLFWRVEQAATGLPIVYTYVLDPAARTYRDGEVFTGTIRTDAPFPLEVALD